MGTRALVHIKQDGVDSDTIVSLYRQFDGYPSGLGDDIKKLNVFNIVNGYSLDQSEGFANGMGCFAAQLLSFLKSGIGNVYVEPLNAYGVGEEFTYRIWKDDGKVRLSVDYGDDTCYNGLLSDFDGDEVEKSLYGDEE